MPVREVKRNYGEQPLEFQGLTAETIAWLTTHITLPEGSTYTEVDLEERFFKLHDGHWYSGGIQIV